NLTAVRRDTENPPWKWRYTYLPVSPGSGNDVWVARNEMTSADFEVGSIVQKHFAWDRLGGVAPYEHVDKREVVDRIIQPGQSGQAIQLTFSTNNTRGVDVPNASGGFDHWDITLNDFG